MNRKTVLRQLLACSAAVCILTGALPCAAAETDAPAETTVAAETTDAAAETDDPAEAAETTAAAAPAQSPELENIVIGGVESDEPTYTCGDYIYTLMENAGDSTQKAACIEKYTGSDAKLVIPDTLDDLPVVALGDYAFVECNTATEITIPASIMGFGTFTFAACTNVENYFVDEANEYFEARDGILYTKDGTGILRYPLGQQPNDVVIPEGIIAIGNVCFASCRYLMSIQLPDSLEYIGTSAFSDCSSLSSIVLPAGIEEIADFTFNGCLHLKEINLPEGLTGIGAAAFCNSGLESITIPESCTSISQQAFAETKLKEVTIPKAVDFIGYTAFGWHTTTVERMEADTDFIIRGYTGSAAEDYAHDTENGNDFQFIALDADNTENGGSAEATATGTEPAAGKEGRLSPVRIIGIAVCCVLFACIAVVAFLSGKKGKENEE